MKRSTVVHSILVYPEDFRRWKRMIGCGEIKPGKKLGIRVYIRDKHRWSKIVKRSAVENKIAADIFKEMLDIVERKRIPLKGKKIADIFKYLLDLYERELLIWGKT